MSSVHIGYRCCVHISIEIFDLIFGVILKNFLYERLGKYEKNDLKKRGVGGLGFRVSGFRHAKYSHFDHYILCTHFIMSLCTHNERGYSRIRHVMRHCVHIEHTLKVAHIIMIVSVIAWFGSLHAQ